MKRHITGDHRRAVALVAVGVAVGVVITLIGVGSVLCQAPGDSLATPVASTPIPEPTNAPGQAIPAMPTRNVVDAMPTPYVVVLPVVEVSGPSDPSNSRMPSPSTATTAEPGMHDAAGAEGASRHTPNPYGATAVDSEWEITVLQSFRGKEAWDLITRATPEARNRLSPGREFVLIEIAATYTGEAGEVPGVYGIGAASFAITGSSGVLWTNLPRRIGPEPRFPIELKRRAGERTQGWIVIDVLEDERDLVLVYTAKMVSVIGYA